MIEENTEFTRRFLKKLILGISATYLLLWLFDGLSFKMTLFSLFTYYIYNQNLKHFPYISLTSPVFVSSCILVVLNHYFWFQYFSNPRIPSIEERLRDDYKPPHIPSFAEIASFFGLLVWLVPIALFISLNVNENSLPINYSDLSRLNGTEDEERKNKGIGLLKLAREIVVRNFQKVARIFGRELDPNNGRII